MIYLRDGASEDYRTVWAEDLIGDKTFAKLAVYNMLFQLPDCAAETGASSCLPRVAEDAIGPTILLNLLTRRLHDVERSYDEWILNVVRGVSRGVFPGAATSFGVSADGSSKASLQQTATIVASAEGAEPQPQFRFGLIGPHRRPHGFGKISTDYLLFLPFKSGIIRRWEAAMFRKIPLGAQYALCATRL